MRKPIRVLAFALACSVSAFTANVNAQSQRFVTITTASAGGTYYPIGVGLGNIWTEKVDGVRATGQSSAGSVENIDLLRNGEADLAILQGLIGAQAVEGSGRFENNTYDDLRTVAMLWPNVEHFLLADSQVKTGNISDIAGNSFSIGPQASGTEESTLIIMRGVGLSTDDIFPEHLGYDAAIAAMRDGRLNGASTPAGVPVAAVMDMYASGYKGTVLEITDEQLDAINKVYHTWFRYVVPANTYPKLDKEINTIAMPNFLGTSVKVDDDLIYALTKATYENLDQVQAIHSSAKRITLETALDGLPAPLHAGAYRYFKEVGLDIPENLIPPEVK